MLMPPTPRLIRFRSGETIICTILDKNTDSTTGVTVLSVDSPMQILTIPVMNKKKEIQQVSIYLREWLDYSSDSIFTIPMDAIITTATPDAEILEDYNEAKLQADMNKISDEFKNITKQFYGGDDTKINEDSSGNLFDKEYNDTNEKESEHDDDTEEDDSEDEVGY